VCGTERSRSLKPFLRHLALAPQPRYVTCTRRCQQCGRTETQLTMTTDTKLKEITVIHILESPSSEDRKADRREGYALGEMLKLSGIKYEYYDINNLSDFEESFQTLTAKIKERQADYGAVNLHISMHGNANGVGLTSGEFVSWEKFAEELKKMASVLGQITIPQVNLKFCPIGLHFSACDGVNAHKIDNFADENEALFIHVLGPNKAVAWDDSLIAFMTFYHNLLSHNIKAKDAVVRMNFASNQVDTFQIRMGKKMMLF
jgi:hypothetical protein